MDVAALNEWITFQVNEATTDKYANHTNGWTDYYRCHATISGEGGSESAVAGTTVENATISFTVRYCAKTSVITSTKYRIVWRGDTYDILAPDHKNMKKRSLRFTCKKVRR